MRIIITTILLLIIGVAGYSQVEYQPEVIFPQNQFGIPVRDTTGPGRVGEHRVRPQDGRTYFWVPAISIWVRYLDTRDTASFGSGSTYTATSPISIDGSNVISMTAASASNAGYITTGAQTIAGAKTFNQSVTVTPLNPLDVGYVSINNSGGNFQFNLTPSSGYTDYGVFTESTGGMYTTGSSGMAFLSDAVTPGPFKFGFASNATPAFSLSTTTALFPAAKLGIGPDAGTPGQIITAHHNQDATTGIAVINNNTGASSMSVVQAISGSVSLNIQALSSGFTPYGQLTAGSTNIYTGGSKHVTAIDNASGRYVVAIGAGVANERFGVSAAGAATFNNAFTFPTADGTNGQVLQTNGSGAVSWQTPSSGADGNGIYGGSGSLSGTTVVTGAGNALVFTSTRTGALATMNVSNTSTGGALIANASGAGTGIDAQSFSGYGGNIFSTSGPGLQVSSSSNTGLIVSSTTGVPAEIQTTPASTNTTVPLLSAYRKSSGTAAANIAGAFDMYNENAGGTDVLSTRLISKLTTATASSEVSQFEIWGVNGGTLAQKFTFLGTGQLQGNAYGTGTFTGTPATRPVFTSSGDMIEEVHPKIYTSLLTQSGTSNPTALVLGTNTVGAIAWARTGAGVYTGTLSGAFTVDKTWLNVHLSDQSGGTIIIAKLIRTDANTVTLSTFNSSLVATDVFTQISLEIKVYP